MIDRRRRMDLTPLMKIVMLFTEPGWQKRTASLKCPKCHFDNPSDTGLPKIADAKKRLAAL
jgi:hypothetical protein